MHVKSAQQGSLRDERLSVQAKGGGRAGLPAAAVPAPKRQHDGGRRCQPGLPHPGRQPHLLLVRALIPAQHASFLKNVLTCMGFRCHVCHQSSTLAGCCEGGLMLPDSQWWLIPGGPDMPCCVLWNLDQGC